MIFARENNMKFCFKHKASNITPQRYYIVLTKKKWEKTIDKDI